MLRFENQGETKEHLEELKKDNEKVISRCREEKDRLQQEFEEMKYSGEAKLSRYAMSCCHLKCEVNTEVEILVVSSQQ